MNYMSNCYLSLEKITRVKFYHNVVAQNPNMCNLESKVNNSYVINLDKKIPLIKDYSSASSYKKKTNDNYYSKIQKPEFNPEILLTNDRPTTPFIGKTSEIRHYITEAFEATTGEKFPGSIEIRILTAEEMKRLNKDWHSGITGFCINRFPYSAQIFVLENNLDKLMITIGHEIGHVLTPTLNNAHNEEAKAFAFSLAWAKAIKERNIAHLSSVIIDKPAENGLHNVAFDFVIDLMQKGRQALEVYWHLIKGIVSMQPLRTLLS